MVARSSRARMGRRALLCLSSYLLLLTPRMLHVAHACSCVEVTDPCGAMWDRPVLVQGTVTNRTAMDQNGMVRSDIVTSHHELQFITYSYQVTLETVLLFHVNHSSGPSDIVQGQTIEVRAAAAGNMCGMQLSIGWDMLLDLTQIEDQPYFRTSSCAMNSFLDNGVIENVPYRACFLPSSTSSDPLVLTPKPTITTTTTPSAETETDTVTVVEELRTSKVGNRGNNGVRGGRRGFLPDPDRMRSKRTISDLCDGCASSLYSHLKDDTEVALLDTTTTTAIDRTRTNRKRDNNKKKERNSRHRPPKDEEKEDEIIANTKEKEDEIIAETTIWDTCPLESDIVSSKSRVELLQCDFDFETLCTYGETCCCGDCEPTMTCICERIHITQARELVCVTAVDDCQPELCDETEGSLGRPIINTFGLTPTDEEESKSDELETESECPEKEPIHGNHQACKRPGLICEYGEECCEHVGCGPSLHCVCDEEIGTFLCRSTDFCYRFIDMPIMEQHNIQTCPSEEPLEDESCSNPGLSCDYTDATQDKYTTCECTKDRTFFCTSTYAPK